MLAREADDGGGAEHEARYRRCSMEETHHSKSLYMMVKKTCRNRLTAFINTASRYNHASPDIVMGFVRRSTGFERA